MLTMEEALRQSDLRFAAGQIVRGVIIEVRPREVLVDIGYKSEGVISASEFEDMSVVKVGDEVPIYIEKLEDRDGMVVVSKEKAEFKQNWEKILSAATEGGTGDQTSSQTSAWITRSGRSSARSRMSVPKGASCPARRRVGGTAPAPVAKWRFS